MWLLPWMALAASVTWHGARTTPMTRPDARTVVVGPATYHPLYPAGASDREVPVPAFRLDRLPVTNADFLAFVRAHPEWRRDRVGSLLADDRYLARWATADALGPGVEPRQPVVEVSWFAARAFCASAGMRLPTRAEWEVAAQASERLPDATGDAVWKQKVLELDLHPTATPLPRVGQSKPNFWGAYDLHGLVWEWVQDFDATGAGSDASRFCGADALTDADKTDFAAFEREALRGSLQAPYTTSNLGFRCAEDVGAPAVPPQDTLYRMHPVLRDQNGAPLPLDVFRGHPLLVSMFYGSCPSACPMLLSNIARIDRELPDAVRADTRVLLVSFDAEHDTPDALRGIAAAHRLDLGRWALAAAPEDDARTLASFLGIAYQKLPGGGFAHTSVIVAFDRAGAPLARAEGADADFGPITRALAQTTR